MQSEFALDTAGAAARASAKKFESRHTMHPQVRTRTDVEAEQFEGGDNHDDVGTVVKTEEESEEEVMAEICELRKRKRGRTAITHTE